MRILMIMPYFPYPTSSGGQIRSNNLIKHLSKSHEITLVSLIKTDEEKKYIKYLSPYCEKIFIFKRSQKPFTFSNVIKAGFSTHPFLVVRNFSTTASKALPDIINEGKFDIIHAETFYVIPNLPETKVPLVLVDQTIEFEVYKHYVQKYRFPFLRPLLSIDVLKLRRWEVYYWKKSSVTVAVSQRDAKIMKSAVPNLDIKVVPNGVGEDLIEDVQIRYNKYILFMGNYSWLQNVEAAKILAKSVFPNIIKHLPGTKLIIAGQFTKKIENLSSENISIVDIQGDDVASVKKYYNSCGLMIAPLYGPGGSRLKILGAMAAKLPVITTSIGISGIKATHQKNVLIGDSPEDLAKLAIRILNNKDLYKKIAINARKFVLENYSYESIAKQYELIYEKLIDKKH
jgi:glycosyltransferase involved in cell wall biosynthesis